MGRGHLEESGGVRNAGAGLRSLRRFRSYGRPHRRVLLAGIAMRAAEMAADLAQPWPLAIIVDSVLGGSPVHGPLRTALGPFGGSKTSLLTVAVVASLGLAALSGAFDYLGDRLMNGAGERITAAIRAEAFGRIQRLPLAYQDRQPVGELASRISSDTDRIEDALVDVFSTLLPGLLTLAGLLVTMVVVDWRLGLLAAASIPLVAITFARYSRLTRAAARTRRAREGALTTLVVEVLSGIRTVHALGGHDVHDRQFDGANQQTLSAGLRAVELRARFTPLVELCAAIGTATLLWVGAWGVLQGLWSLGRLLVMLSYLRNMLKPLRSLSNLSLTLSRASASAERVADILDEPLPTGFEREWSRERPTNEAPHSMPARTRGRIELRDVSFDYGRGTVLGDLDLVVHPGDRLAILGPNGAGKSSLLSLVAGLYEPSSGTILIDEFPVTHVSPGWLRSQVAVVLQDTLLFAGTLRDNIAYGRRGATEDEILDAADGALVTEFARSLPRGFDTPLGDRGVGLSGGQRQRVAIARALLRRAPVVLLDEPTSGLDLEAERVVVEGLQKLVAGSTVLMVTHRPAVLRLADRAVVLHGGSLVPIERRSHHARTAPPSDRTGRTGLPRKAGGWMRTWREQLEEAGPASQQRVGA